MKKEGMFSTRRIVAKKRKEMVERPVFHLDGSHMDRAQVLTLAERVLKKSNFGSAKLRNCLFGHGAWEALGEALAAIPGLKKVRLERCAGVDLGLLGKCNALEELFLVEMAVQGAAVVVESAPSLAVFANVVLHDFGRHYESFGLRTSHKQGENCGRFPVQFLGSLVSELISGPLLTQAVFYYCSLGDVGACAVANVLEKNKTLTALTILQSGVGYIGCAALAQALKRNSTLASLNLTGNKIQSRGVVVLADVLKSNRSLRALTFVDCDIGFDGLAALLVALTVNTTLKTLEFGAFSPLARKFMADLLPVNGSITNLKLTNVCCNPFNDFNKHVQKRARKAVVAFILCWKMRDRDSVLAILNKELVVPIAKAIWATKGELAWRKKSGLESSLELKDRPWFGYRYFS